MAAMILKRQVTVPLWVNSHIQLIPGREPTIEKLKNKLENDSWFIRVPQWGDGKNLAVHLVNTNVTSLLWEIALVDL